MLIAPLRRVADVAEPLTHGVAALERGLALLEGSLAETGGAAQPTPVRGHIVLQQVGLQFGDDLAPALQHIDLDVQPGQVGWPWWAPRGRENHLGEFATALFAAQ